MGREEQVSIKVSGRHDISNLIGISIYPVTHHLQQG
jgi:hypothetical protein